MPPLPFTKEEVLATGVIDPELEAALKAKPIPPGSAYTLEQLKEINEVALPWHQERLMQSKPANITEYERQLPVGGGHTARLIVCQRSSPSKAANRPLVVLLHGGGHCVGNPESEVPLARRLALELDAVVVLPTYRLAPEFPFPASINDSWNIVQHLAAEADPSRSIKSRILPSQCDPRLGFIVGGTSAGANLAASITHLARDSNLTPCLTGQMLIAGTFISPQHVPIQYSPFYLARDQNKNAPILDLDLYNLFQTAFKPDHMSPLWAIFDQRHPLDANTEDGGSTGVRHGHLNLPPAYFQICGLDIGRDDSLIYERVLREESNVSTRADLYPGFSHCWWSLFPELGMSKRREDDAVRGVAWLLSTPSVR
ncbi:uncharacterized protein JN550_002726 [Neoarthrinium moseri]|uniref:uncharacterized protein n=1 Tax=Neoarthrinium moseri TaxID=1658444 RepID=UPI001FDE3F83|nr:uncharacterized protein JN550_002726 [Neoarthrinium moseri]KAI1874147.1 hypothetical protein JN550_002726 [Neoarthrinium moseri]